MPVPNRKLNQQLLLGVDGRRSEQLVGDASHYTGVLAVAA